MHYVPFNSVASRSLVVLLLLCLARPVLAEQHTILVVGDSISAAYGMSLEQGWVAMMAEELSDSHPQYGVVNASISGETTAGALQRLPPLLEQHRPSIVVIELGGNDGLRGYPLPDLRKNLASLATLSSEAGARVILVPMEIPPNYGNRYTEGFRESFIIVADSTGSTLAPFLLEEVAFNPLMMQADGIHPKAEAQSVMMATFMPTLMELIE